MKTNKQLIIIFVLCMLGITGQSFAQDEEAIKKQIKEYAKMSSEKMVSGDFSADHYADDAISLPDHAPMLVGIDAIKASFDQAKAAGIKFDSFAATPTQIMVNGKMVTEIGTYSMSMTMPNMPAPFKEEGKYLTLWEIQVDGSLKIKVDTWNTNVPPPMN